MKRRTVLSGVAAGVATGLAGCLDTGPAPGDDGENGSDDGGDSGDGGSGDDGYGDGDDGSGDGGSGDDGSGDGDSGTETTTSPGTPSVRDSSLTVGSASCGNGENSASVSVETTDDAEGSPAGVVSVDGTIMGNDQCHTAKLKAATYDEAADTLTVTVVSYVPDDESDSVCGQCIVDIEYEATVEMDGAVPGTITVYHGDEEVTSASPQAN